MTARDAERARGRKEKEKGRESQSKKRKENESERETERETERERHVKSRGPSFPVLADTGIYIYIYIQLPSANPATALAGPGSPKFPTPFWKEMCAILGYGLEYF